MMKTDFDLVAFLIYPHGFYLTNGESWDRFQQDYL